MIPRAGGGTHDTDQTSDRTDPDRARDCGDGRVVRNAVCSVIIGLSVRAWSALVPGLRPPGISPLGSIQTSVLQSWPSRFRSVKSEDLHALRTVSHGSEMDRNERSYEPSRLTA